MTVSAPNTHVRYHGNFERAELMRPAAFQLAAHVHNMMALGEISSDARTRRFQNGDAIRVLSGGGMTWIDIYAAGEGGVYEVIDETKIVYDLYMDPILYFDSSTEERLDGDDEKCRNADEYSENECYSQRLFERVEIARDKDDGTMVFTPRDFTSYNAAGELTYDTKLFSKNMALNKVCYPFNRTKSHGLHHCYSSWSKTIDQYTAHAILYYNAYAGFNMWCIAVDVAGVAFNFQPAGTSPISYHWPVGGYLDVVWCSVGDPYNTTATYKCFDLWKEDVTEDDGTVVPHYFVSCIGDPDSYIQVWDLTTRGYSYIPLSTATDYAEAQWPDDPDGWKSRHIRHIGLIKRTLYWAHQDNYYGVPVGASGTIHWENDDASGTVDFDCTGCGIQFAILNEFTQEIEWMDDIACQECAPHTDQYAMWLYACYGYASVNGVNQATWSCDDVSSFPCYHTVGGQTLTYYRSCTQASFDAPPLWTLGTNATWALEDFDDRQTCDQTGEFSGGREYGDSGILLRQEVRASVGDSVENGCEPSQCGYWQGTIDNCHHDTKGSWRDSDDIISAHVLPGGLGVQYSVDSTSGELLVCDEVEEINTMVSTETIDEFGVFDANYAQSHWPYYPQYAIMVSGEVCNKPILTEKKKYTKPGDRFIDGIRIKPTEDFIEENCRFSLGGDNYSIVLDNNGTLHDNLGNTFNRTFEATEVGLFFLEQRKVKTRRINEYVD